MIRCKDLIKFSEVGEDSNFEHGKPPCRKYEFDKSSHYNLLHLNKTLRNSKLHLNRLILAKLRSIYSDFKRFENTPTQKDACRATSFIHRRNVLHGHGAMNAVPSAFAL